MVKLVPLLIAAAGGGALGASLRVVVVTYLVPGPVGIFVLNVAGALLLGLTVTALGERAPLLLLFLGGGILGSLTTFSTFAGDAVRLATEAPLMAGIYVVGSVTAAIIAFAAGSVMGRAL